MKNIGFIYSSDQRFEELIAANELSPKKEYLIRIHTCIHNVRTIRPFINKILSYLPNAKIIGSSTSGVIFNGEIVADCCLISISEFEDSSVETAVSMLNDDSGNDLEGSIVADKIAEKLIHPNTKFMLAFMARTFMKIEGFVERFNADYPDIQIIGGVANTPSIPVMNLNIVESFVFNEKGVYQNSVVCAALTSKKLSVFSDVIYVTEPVGETHTITEVDGNIIRTIDGIDTVKWYEELLGIRLNDMESFNIPVLFPLVKADRNNVPWALFYSPQDENNSISMLEPDPLMYVLSEAKVGNEVKIAYTSVQKTIEVCENVCENLNDHPAEALFGYSCVSRQRIFANCAKWELMPFNKTNLCGALVAGEFVNIDNTNRYSSYSFTIAALAENECYPKINTAVLSEHHNELINNNESIIEYLLNHVGADNAISKHHEIEKKMFVDNKTGLGNLTKFLYDLNLGKLDKICMITIKNESLIKAFMSEDDFSHYLNQVDDNIISYISNDHYNYYIYKETSFIVSADKRIEEKEFVGKMQELQNHLLEFKFSNYVPVYEFSVVMNEENLIKKAELTLGTMRSQHTCFLTYTPDLGLEKFNAQKMKMLTILNNAVSNDLVIPYFQGIRDNTRGRIDMYESLMRIEDVEGNIYSPYQFMDIAKEYGYYLDISEIMINKVLNIFRERDENVTINMNISDVYNYKTVHSILEFLKKAPNPENFVFELTETEEIKDYQVIFEFVQKVRESGGKIAIDDFGSGFSNIVHIFKIPSDFIKIDGEIIRNITSDVYALEFLEMISDWSRRHSKEIIAEYVEDKRIQKIVERHKIRFSQGYLYSKPSKLF
ncbi:MAG: EAL domain-containing protein [Clostridium sp.]|nr:EAL domain-containing protein [Clostridium sp.]MCM1547785.1 EAL domain-containing protein [Ruminococcus sp.]